PCHMDSNTYNDIKEILKSIENIEFVDFNGQEDCCGFGGDFFTRHGNTAIKLSEQKVQNILNSGACVVLTSCPACLLSLKFGINAIKFKQKRKIDLKALDLAEFLSVLQTF
ncbi:MAG: hypothetical protein LUE64_07030, partial [Candidatus Gastranaerophilales bacterium]|nr:hypothetical protein [Candidatus Gastranaerophilales bacterium]